MEKIVTVRGQVLPKVFIPTRDGWNIYPNEFVHIPLGRGWLKFGESITKSRFADANRFGEKWASINYIVENWNRNLEKPSFMCMARDGEASYWEILNLEQTDDNGITFTLNQVDEETAKGSFYQVERNRSNKKVEATTDTQPIKNIIGVEQEVGVDFDSI